MTESAPRTRIKICGLTNADDARAAVRFGADALGFIGVPESPRYVSPDAMRGATRGLPPFVTPTVVVRKLSDALPYAGCAGAVQYYDLGDAATLVLSRLPMSRIPALRMRGDVPFADTFYLAVPRGVAPVAVLLDAYHDTALGGTGSAWDWNRAVEARRFLGDIPLILAGGLTPENAADAVRQVRPYAVDVSSGVESEPGRKDHDKLHRFIQAVRDADA